MSKPITPITVPAAREPSMRFSAVRRAGARADRCFTLIELLTTIAVIGILSALLLPAMSQSKRKAHAVSCKGNLHQIGIGLGLYLNDYAGIYPHDSSIPAPNPKAISSWFDALSTELSNAKWGEGVFRCPLYPGSIFEGQARTDRQGRVFAVYAPCGSYAYNVVGRRSLVNGPCGLVAAGLGFVQCAGKLLTQPIHEHDIRAPAELYVVGDSPLAIAPWGPVTQPRLGGAANYNCFAASNAIMHQVQHATAFNMLCADAHVESIGTNNLLAANPASRKRWHHDNLP